MRKMKDRGALIKSSTHPVDPGKIRNVRKGSVPKATLPRLDLVARITFSSLSRFRGELSNDLLFFGGVSFFDGRLSSAVFLCFRFFPLWAVLCNNTSDDKEIPL